MSNGMYFAEKNNWNEKKGRRLSVWAVL